MWLHFELNVIKIKVTPLNFTNIHNRSISYLYEKLGELLPSGADRNPSPTPFLILTSYNLHQEIIQTMVVYYTN